MQLATVFRLILASAWLTLGVAHAQGSADYQFQTRAALPLGLGGHAATVLDSGMVLVVGGQAQSSAYQSACYLYDPALDLWTATGALAEARRGVKLAHLNGGGVLAVGGSIGDSSASVERYNPTDGQWQVVESMGVARDSHAVVTLIDGSVLAIGGRELVSGTGTVLSSVKRFDPGTGLWSAATPMIYTRMNHTATLLDNGEVLVAGGYGGSAVGALSSAEIYNPRTGVWRPAADLPETRLNHIDLPLNSGEVMLVGGNAAPFGAGVNIGLIYDSVADSWRSSAPSVFARRNTSAVRLQDGKIAVLGGGSPGELIVTNSAEVYNPASDSWTATQRMIERRFLHVSVVLQSGDVLVIGGQRPTPSVSNLSAVEMMMPPPDELFSSDFEDALSS